MPEVPIRGLQYDLNDKRTELVAEKEVGVERSCTTLKVFSDLYSLSNLKKAAFYITASALLNSFLHMIRNDGRISNIKALRLYLVDDGGTRKSMVIKAVEYLS